MSRPERVKADRPLLPDFERIIGYGRQVEQRDVLSNNAQQGGCADWDVIIRSLGTFVSHKFCITHAVTCHPGREVGWRGGGLHLQIACL